MPKYIVVILLLALSGFSVPAQDCKSFFPTDEGAVRVMKSFNARDKYEGKIVQTVKEVTRAGGKLNITIQMQHFDKKDELYHEGEMEFKCEDGIFKMDMQSYSQGYMLESMQGMELEIDGTNLELPANIKPGKKLEEGIIRIQASTGGMTIMTMFTRIHNRKVEALEPITTEAGTFECYKITQDIEVKTITTINIKSIEWIAEGVGAVRTETYDNKGKLTGYTLLTKME